MNTQAIARAWKCLCPADTAEAFLAHLLDTGVRDAAATPGFMGYEVLTRLVDAQVEVTLVTFWDRLESIRAFAGQDLHTARLYPGDQAFGITPDPLAVHYAVARRS